MGVETILDFHAASAEGLRSLTMTKSAISGDRFVKWEVEMRATPNPTKGLFNVLVVATAFATGTESKKFVHACLKVTGGYCTEDCYFYMCRESNHKRMACVKESLLGHNFQFKVDDFHVYANTQFLRGNIGVACLSVKVSLTHFKTLEQPIPSADTTVNNNLQAMLESGDLADVVFILKGEEIRAHSQILGAASPVFRAMFVLDTDDRRTGRVTVDGVEPPVFKKMLRCIYSSSGPEWTDEDDDFLVGLFLLAEKYMLEALRGQCVRRVISTLTVDNVVARLRAVHAVSPSLVPLVVDAFVKQNHLEILQSESWKDLMKEDVALAADVMLHALTS